MTIQTVIPTPYDWQVKGFLRLGFVLSEPVPWSSDLRIATLPDGWSIERIEKRYCHINDAQGRKRIYLGLDSNGDATSSFMTRYQLQPCYTVDLVRGTVKGAIKEGDRVLHEVLMPFGTGDDPIRDCSGSVAMLKLKGNHFLEAWLMDHGLGNWKDPFAYWDAEPLTNSPAT